VTQPNPDDKTYVVYTVFQPDVRTVVSQREYDELKAQGLVSREGRVTEKDGAPEVAGQKPA
jgi:hypothetical protein